MGHQLLVCIYYLNFDFLTYVHTVNVNGAFRFHLKKKKMN